ncbi:MAG TPA: hypothetical protein VLA15_10995, partial [Desulfurivibrionaceae bacterium]|nr:hypothetical protein [Desulfurivibrionaceae bacterium]
MKKTGTRTLPSSLGEKSTSPPAPKTTEAAGQIEKQSWKPGNVLSPVPVVLVSCGGSGEFRP